MNYRLCVLTHGDHATLAATVDSFLARVTPGPAEVCMLYDGPRVGMPSAPHEWKVWWTEGPDGFCKATRALWHVASQPGADYVFWLEHDLIVTEDISLPLLAAVLDLHPKLAQMALMRDAVNEAEKAAGGLFESRRGQYVPEAVRVMESGEPLPWLSHRSYYTTNANLMRRKFMDENPWPSYDSECEGRFGLDLVAKGYSFGVWGDGRPMTRHVGVRTGFGY